MQIDYVIARGKEQMILRWTKEFCRRKNITGSICFDFMEDPATGEAIAGSLSLSRSLALSLSLANAFT